MLNCFKCDKGFDPALTSKFKENQPYEGTIFISFGQYGSTVFDPSNQYVFLEINICDDCLKANQSQILLVNKYVALPQYTYKPWKYDEPSN